jgi:3-oxosteroid 1-dehydrogenase
LDEIFDFVVVGSGGGSMCAALRLRAAGKSVAILEKTELVGGCTAMSGGVMWIPNNRFMREAGIDDSVAKALTYLDALVAGDPPKPGAGADRRRTYVRESPRMVDFLVDQGIKLRRISWYPDYYDALPGGQPKGRTVVADLFDINELGAWKDRLRPASFALQAYMEELMQMPFLKRSWRAKRTLLRIGLRTLLAKLAGRHWVTAGAALQGRMLQAALRTGAHVQVNSSVKQLIIEDGRCTGVVTEREGRDWRIGARLGVLINAGGFARNQAMRDRFCRGTSTQWTNAPEGDTGEMILEAERIGAALGQMEERVGNPMSIPPGTEGRPPSMQMDMAKPHAILVDQLGARYMSEAGSYMELCKAMLRHNEIAPAVPSWMVFDSQYLRKYMLAGTMPGSTKPQVWLDSGYLRKADDIKGLAAACQIDPERLQATVDRFNTLARNNRDEDFHRGECDYHRWSGDWTDPVAPSLGTVEEGPFYAVAVVPGDLGTLGGLVTDCDARVLRDDGSAIEGLYATGNSSATVMGGYYPGAGSSVGPSFTWGYVAAKHALTKSA